MIDRSPARARGGPGRSWLFTALTGAGLLVLVTVHMIAHHFVVEEVGGLRTYRQVLEYVGDPRIVAVEGALLLVVTWHAMLGLRSVLLDLKLPRRLHQLIGPGIWVLGILTLAYGTVLIGTLAARA
jgi:succinate dehydrogenase / fumarate reductase membrane anchor subunit